MKKLFSLFAAFLFVGSMWGTLSSPYTCTFTSGMSESNNQVTTGDVTWTLARTTGAGSPTTTFGNQNGQSCIKFGSGKSNYYSGMTLTTSAFSSYNVTSVELYISSNNGGSKTITVTQGSTTIGSKSQTFSSNTWVTNSTYNTTSGSGGNLVISISSDATATFIHSIKVTYTTSAKTCADPAFSEAAGHFTENFDLTLSCSTGGASIHYTLDGTDPTASSTLYENPIAISATTTVKAIAVKDDWEDSHIVSATYTKVEPITTTTIDFEMNDIDMYIKWDFVNIGIHEKTVAVPAHGGNYYGSNVNDKDNATNTASITSIEAIANPQVLRFYISKESTNTTTSTWTVEVSANNSDWTEVASFDAKGMDKGVWQKCEANLTNYTNVYVRISYSGAGAKRAIDDIEFITPPTYASLAALVAAELEAGTVATVSFSNVQITAEYDNYNGFDVNVTDKDGVNDISIHCAATEVPDGWNVNGYVSSTAAITGTWSFDTDEEYWYLEIDNWDDISYSATPTALEDVDSFVKSVKFIENGQLFIEKSGRVYNVMGQLIK